MQLGKDKQASNSIATGQAEGAYQACQHIVAFVESAHEVGVHVEHGAVSCPVTIVTIIHLHSGPTLNPKSSDLSAFDVQTPLQEPNRVLQETALSSAPCALDLTTF